MQAIKTRSVAFDGALSQQTGVHIETIRYHERVKMLAAPPRTEGGRRVIARATGECSGSSGARGIWVSASTKSAPLLDLDGPGRASCADVREIARLRLA